MPVKSENENLVKYLIELGVDINKGNKENETPLFNACSSENENLVKYLIEYEDKIKYNKMKRNKMK